MKASIFLIIILLTACGGGGGGDGDQNISPIVVQSYTAETALAADAPVNDLTPAEATLASTSYSSVCTQQAGSKVISGVVTSVHDGDTLTVSGRNIRLDSIDAPELTQSYGDNAREALAGYVLNKMVTVQYHKLDKYGRTVGQVFDASCNLINLSMVRTGNAWYYETYKCEIAQDLRNDFAVAQSTAKASRFGLWSGSATAPWYYRNGKAATVPTCSSDSPVWPSTEESTLLPSYTETLTGVIWLATNTIVSPVTAVGSVLNPPATTTPSTTPTPSPVIPSSCPMVWVNGYYKSNGTYVSGYWRRSPGCA